jgi:hypothetical protein
MNSLIALTAQIVVRILRRGTERKIENVLAEDQVGFRRINRTREAMDLS